MTACDICEKGSPKHFAKDKNHQKVRDHYHIKTKYRCAGHSICNLMFNVLNQIPVVFQSKSK